MKFLLDTHTFLWFVNDNPRLSDQLKDLIEDENNATYLSLASLWEMSIKYSLGKLSLSASYEEFVEEEVVKTNLNLLNIKLAHLNVLATLPLHHRDPFDRLIIAQSIAEELPIITVDPALAQYPVTLIN